ncbi:hypothetical protein KCU62_g5459, partial [Aureobasidium sp. EXF-3399]
MRIKRLGKEPSGVTNNGLFANITRPYQQIFIVIDGLDECPEERRSPILDFIVEVSSRTDSNINFFVSSREETDISARFKYLNALIIELETRKITADIQSYVRDEALRLRSESRLCVRDDALFAEIVLKLVEKSNGMFLWVNLQLQQLCRISKGADDQELRQALDYLPQGLVPMYTRILDDIADGNEHARKVALECFRWMMYAKGPLSLDVFRVAVTLLKAPRTTQELMSRLSPGDYIVGECRNLVRLSGTNNLDESIIPIHFSFLEYLEDLPLDKLQGDFWSTLKNSQVSESVLARGCIDWLLLALPDEWEHSETWATYMHLSYPVKFFDKHAVCAISRSQQVPAKLLKSIDRLLSANTGKLAYLVKLRLMRMPLGRSIEGQQFDQAISKNYLLWTSSLYLIPGLDNRWMELSIPKYALHLAVWFRPEEVQELIWDGHHVDELDPCQRTPLSYACGKGCLNTVELLLRASARIDADSSYESPLSVAIRKDHLEITKVLLKKNPSICLQSDVKGLVPLMVACSLEMVQLLCDIYNSDVHATDRVGRSVLGYHVGAGPLNIDVSYTEVTRILNFLIERGADIYAKSEANMSLVDYAVCAIDGAEPLRFLLQYDPRLLEKEPDDWTFLHWACRGNHPRMTETLLEHGSEVKSVTTVHPPQTWTPYDIFLHYGNNPRWFDESTTRALGALDETASGLDHLSKVEIDFDSLTAQRFVTNLECTLCAMQVRTGLLFACQTCGVQTCLMCKHTLHNNKPNHVLNCRYIFMAGIVHLDLMQVKQG